MLVPQDPRRQDLQQRQAQRDGTRQYSGPGQEDHMVLLDQLQQTRPTSRPSQSQPADGAILPDTAITAKQECQRQVEIEKKNKVQVPKPRHDRWGVASL